MAQETSSVPVASIAPLDVVETLFSFILSATMSCFTLSARLPHRAGCSSRLFHFVKFDWSAARFHLALTMDKIKNSPSVDVDKPVSRQHERDYYGYYGWPYYWGAEGMWGMGAYPNTLAAGALYNPSAEYYEEPGDIHLRSAQEVRGYHIQGSDESIGHVDDFIVDDQTWAIRYLVIDTSNWWVGKKVLVAPPWVTSVSWEQRNVYVAMSRQAIKDSPEWNAYAAVNREYETRLYDYYGRPAYWESGVGSEMSPVVHHAHSP